MRGGGEQGRIQDFVGRVGAGGDCEGGGGGGSRAGSRIL